MIQSENMRCQATNDCRCFDNFVQLAEEIEGCPRGELVQGVCSVRVGICPGVTAPPQ